MNTNEISQGINRLKNRIDEALNRSQSATLNSHRGLSATLDAAPQVEANRNASYTTTEADLYRSVQNYQVKTVHGFEPSYLPVHNHYQGYAPTQSYVQPLIIPYGHQYPVQEVRSATYGYEPYVLSAPTHFYQPVEYVDDYEGTLSQRNQSSGKKKTIRGRKEDIQNDQDSFSKDSKKTQPQAQQNQSNSAPQQNKPAQQNQPAPQNQASQQSQPAPQNQAAQQNQPAPQNQASQQNQPAPQNQASQKSQPVQQNQNGQSQQKPVIDKSNLVQLPKKPYLIDTYNFGQEKRRGGSQRI